MSSSKIQEYNLDPNMGLAKESTSQEIKEIVEDMNTNLSGSLTAKAVKSIQRHSRTHSGGNSVQTKTYEIDISTVNPDKCDVSFHYSTPECCFVIASFTATKITIQSYQTSNGTVTVQIVEHY